MEHSAWNITLGLACSGTLGMEHYPGLRLWWNTGHGILPWAETVVEHWAWNITLGLDCSGTLGMEHYPGLRLLWNTGHGTVYNCHTEAGKMHCYNLFDIHF